MWGSDELVCGGWIKRQSNGAGPKGARLIHRRTNMGWAL